MTATTATSPASGAAPADPGPLRLGIDIGSTTVKAVALDGAGAVFKEYRRHNADVRLELAKLLRAVAQAHPGRAALVAVTGSGGLGVAQALGVEFVQEVIAGTEAIRRLEPEADVIIELGGEDAKITYLRPVLEQRMNGTCAGGTGAFIDQMATLLGVDAAGLNALARDHTTLYPIASRCGVFAKTDLQPLLNDGAAREDLAASIFQAVATQTIAGLACGRPVRGRVVALGGPLHFLDQLRAAFERALTAPGTSLVAPPEGQLAVAFGAALLAESPRRAQLGAGAPPAFEPVALEALAARAHNSDRSGVAGAGRLRVLFADRAERDAFEARHAAARLEQIPIEQAKGACFLGIDAGSTTIKAVLIDESDRICYSHYAPNQGSTVKAAVGIVQEVRKTLPRNAIIARSCVTGYGESLIRAALRVDVGVVETIAHHRAADHFRPGVTAVVDIGGQDMKYLRIVDGAIDEIRLNEACSSGCGSFLQTFAQTMGLSLEAFCEAALASFAPVDLGSRCTVFMNSSVKAAQKEGAAVGDIAAGLSYSVVRNALYKVIKLREAGQLGREVVVQGGTFLSDAVLRAFELLTGLEVTRPDRAGLMGAFGAALVARESFRPGRPSSLAPPLTLRGLQVVTSTETCRLCQNHCKCTVSEFGDGSRHVSGNRCERGGDKEKPKSALPNLFDYKYKRLFAYRRLTEKAATRGDIGVPRVLNIYENYPLWFTVLTRLGFRVTLSGRSSHELFVAGMDSIASENICYPAKLAHGHIEQLIARGVRTIFYPSVSYERELAPGADDHFNCPIVTGYPQVLANNVEALRAGARVRLINPFFNLASPEKLAERLVDVFQDWAVTLEEARDAVAAGYAEQAAFAADVAKAGEEALDFARRTGTRAVVLAGRPYHVDPEIHHGIPELITSLGMAVLTEDSVAHLGELDRPLRVRDQWAYHSRLYQAAAATRLMDGVELVQLNSFGCGLDAITTDQVQEILRSAGRVHTCLKIDEVSNLGAARIRLRSLAAAADERSRRAPRPAASLPGGPLPGGPARGQTPADATQPTARGPAERAEADGIGHRAPPRKTIQPYAGPRPVFTKAMRTAHTIIAPQLSPVHMSLLEAALNGSGYRVRVLREAGADAVETGLRHVNNDACYPAIMVVGQLVHEFTSGGVDPAATSVMITQTGGMCRATNYTALLRKALAEAGYPDVPVIAVSTRGIERNPGFKLRPMLLHRAMRAIALGDILEAGLLRVRPYEAEKGAATAAYRQLDAAARAFLAGPGLRPGYRALVRRIIRTYDAVPRVGGERKPRVGIVGEILVKFHPDANNHVVDVVESEGFEARLPGLMEFVVNGMHTAEWSLENLGVGGGSLAAKRILRWWVDRYRAPVRRALRAAELDYPPPGDVARMAREASAICSLGNQAGEGWLLTAEILELIESGVEAIICAQPFACLPNHVTGKGMFREIMRRHPGVNIVTIEYDPGASPVNQLNRIKLLLAAARLAAAAPAAPASPAREPVPAAR